MIYYYYRTSELEAALDEDQLDGILGPELLTMQTYCLEKNWLLAGVWRDLQCPWDKEFRKRKSGKELMDMLRPGDVVLSSRLERIVSSSQEAVKLIRIFREKQVQLHIAELGSEITGREFVGNFEKIAGLFSSLEKRKSAERIKGIKQQQRQKGRYLGGSLPFGYMIHSNGRLIENPMEQRVLKEIMDLKKQGKSLRAISNKVSTPVMPISFKTVQRLLQRHADQP